MSGKSLRENLIFLAVALIAFATSPALAPAQTSFDPRNFTEPQKLSRGSLTPLSPGAFYLTEDETCPFVTESFGWTESDCAALDLIVFLSTPEVDTLIIHRPNSDGYVPFDDWEGGAPQDEIDTIWNQIVEKTKDQSERMGFTIASVNWIVYPTLDPEQRVLYYAIEFIWDGEKVLNIRSSYFDRKGFVWFDIVPIDENLSSPAIAQVVADNIAAYEAEPENHYLSFESGDKVAAAGVLGVLATLLGVKYGKGFFATAAAVALAFLKKAWFVLLIPLAFLAKLFRKK